MKAWLWPNGLKHGVAGISVVLLAMLAGGATSARKTPNISAPEGWHWKLSWSDQFNRGAADLKGWHYDLGGGGWGNGESEVYTHPHNYRPPPC